MLWRNLIALLILSGCSATMPPAMYYTKNELPTPTLESFPHCRFYGCQNVDNVKLNNTEWKQLAKYFPANSPEEERDAITNTIAEFENIVGRITGTNEDVKGTYITTGMFQHDCIDESVNTTTYLMLMQQKGWLKFHTPQAPNSRFPPHRTAVIMETKTDIRYAVDSWFHDNGHKAEIIDLKTWKSGWHPPKESKSVP